MRERGERRRAGTAARAVTLTAVLVGLGPALVVAQDAPPPETTASTPVVVEVEPGEDPRAVARDLGVSPDQVYDTVIDGFAADLPPAALRRAERSGSVRRVTRDVPVRAAAQILPTGVNRVDADRNAQAGINRNGGTIDADVAVLDTGIARHPDLRVVGGTSCVGRGGNRPRDWNDGDGHGTHVAGTIAAEDDNRSVVGVAPGARLWAVKVLDDRGVGSVSTVICGLEWVLDRATIDVVNMSLEGPLPENNPALCTSSAYHQAICRVSRGAGIPVVVAAGNGSRPASRTAPAAYQETIAVSAFTDFDGRSGGAGRATCENDRDDTFASYSNFGPEVDIAAPGTCIRSTSHRGGLSVKSGTSMAAPHVAGALALYAATNPRATEPQARAWLLETASRPQDAPEGFTGDPDGAREPVLYLGPPSGTGSSPDETPTPGGDGSTEPTHTDSG